MDTATLYLTWGERIRRARLAAQLNQAELAAAVGTSQQRISQYETGVRRVPDVLRPKLAAALDVDVAELFTYEDRAVAS